MKYVVCVMAVLGAGAIGWANSQAFGWWGIPITVFMAYLAGRGAVMTVI